MAPTNTAEYDTLAEDLHTLHLHGRHLFLVGVLVWSIYISYEAPSEQCNFLKRLQWSNAVSFNDTGGAMQFF